MDLIIIACAVALAGAPADCREHRVPISVERTEPTACTHLALFVVPRWQAAHPETTIDRWHCRPAGRS